MKRANQNTIDYAKCMIEKEKLVKKEKKILFHKMVMETNKYLNCAAKDSQNKEVINKCLETLKREEKILLGDFFNILKSI